MKKLSEVAKLVDLPRQRIQEYEKAGIAFKPKVKNNHGDWLYGEAEIERLWQIKFYLTLGFRIPRIKVIFADPNYNKHDAIAAQIIELEEQKKKLEAMIEVAHVHNEIGCKSTREVFDNGRNHGICWFISRAIEIYCNHQREAIGEKEKNNE